MNYKLVLFGAEEVNLRVITLFLFDFLPSLLLPYFFIIIIHLLLFVCSFLGLRLDVSQSFLLLFLDVSVFFFFLALFPSV